MRILPLIALMFGPIVTDAPVLTQSTRGSPTVAMDSALASDEVWELECAGTKCSDGRSITTVRAGTVPCETLPGVWTHVPANTACVNWKGELEVWGANTNQYANSANPGAMSKTNTPTIVGQSVEDTDPGALQGVFSAIPATVGAKTLACYLRAGSTPNVALRFNSNGTGGMTCAFSDLSSASNKYSCSTTIGGTPSFISSIVYPGETSSISGAGVGSVFLDACWATESSTPGRACWQASGAAPYTCNADVHTVSTTGWPTIYGRIGITFKAEELAAGLNQMLLDGRQVAGVGPVIHISATKTFRINSSGTALEGGTIVAGRTYYGEVERTPEGIGRLYLDGVLVASGAMPAMAWEPTAVVGSNLNKGGGDAIQGSIRSLKVKTYTGGSCTAVAGVGMVCSDGRTLATTRSTAVPCETQDGTWTYTPANQACVSVRGLESWGANTTLVSNGGDLDIASWQEENGATITKLPDNVTRRITKGVPLGGMSDGSFTPAAGKTYTLAAIMRAGTATSASLVQNSGSTETTPSCHVDLSSTLAVQSCTATDVALGASGRRKVYHKASTSAGDYFDVRAIWQVEAATPGRPCWQASGAAPFTCAADVTTISTSGFPTTAGRVRLRVRAEEIVGNQLVLDGRTVGSTGRPYLYVGVSGRLRFGVGGGSEIGATSGAWTAGEHEIEIRLRGGVIDLALDGVVIGTGSFPALVWDPTAFLGSQGVTAHLNGTLSHLSWSTR